jgi:hypothetical protein
MTTGCAFKPLKRAYLPLQLPDHIRFFSCLPHKIKTTTFVANGNNLVFPIITMRNDNHKTFFSQQHPVFAGTQENEPGRCGTTA